MGFRTRCEKNVFLLDIAISQFPNLAATYTFAFCPMTGADKAIDGDSSTKWFDSARAPLVVQLASSAEVEALGYLGVSNNSGFSPQIIHF